MEKKIQKKIRLTEDMIVKLNLEAERMATSFNETVETAIRYYISRDAGVNELWVGKFQKLNSAFEEEQMRIRGITTMLLYLAQTFFYVHPEIRDGYEDSIAYKEAATQCAKWFEESIAEMGRQNHDFIKKLKAALDKIEINEKEKEQSEKGR